MSSRKINVFLLLVWVLLVSYQISIHVMWRDEVRALTIALQGSNVFEMLQQLHGEGHPALWFLLLRGGYALVRRPETLAIVALLIALGNVILVLFRSPFPAIVRFALAFSNLLIYEYAVVARNYGVSVLIMFLFAARYRQRKGHDLVSGLLLLALANTNLIAAIMVCGFLLLEGVTLLAEQGLRWTPSWKRLAVNAALGAAGLALCLITVLPTYNDAAKQSHVHGLLHEALGAIFSPGGSSLRFLLPEAPTLFSTAVLFCLPLAALAKRTAAIAILLTMLATSLFFVLAAGGADRHAGVFLFFCVAVYWMYWDEITKIFDAGSPHRLIRLCSIMGWCGFGVLFLVQFGMGAYQQARAVQIPQGRAADLAAFMKGHPELSGAVILADPDFLVEPLSYYMTNRVYLPRENRMGSVVHFSRSVKSDLTLGELFERAQRVETLVHSPVIILLNLDLNQIIPGDSYPEGYNWRFSASAKQISDFRKHAEFLARFGPATTDETYFVYRVK